MQRTPARDALEAGGVERVYADVDPIQARGRQREGQFGQQDTVGGHRHFLDARHLLDAPHQFDDVPAHRRLAAGQPNLAHAQPGRRLHDKDDFIILQKFSAWLELHLFRHAVDTAQIADIGQGNAQVVNPSSKRVVQAVVHGHKLRWL